MKPPIQVVNPYFVEGLMSGQQKLIMTFSDAYRNLNYLHAPTMAPIIHLAFDKLNGQTLVTVRTVFAQALAVHSVPVTIFQKTRKLVMDNAVLMRGEAQLLIKQCGFDGEERFWEAFDHNCSGFIVRLDNIRPFDRKEIINTAPQGRA